LRRQNKEEEAERLRKQHVVDVHNLKAMKEVIMLKERAKQFKRLRIGGGKV
jgi:hypothetical protein